MAVGDDAGRLDVLDGWRGISILLVLATHLLPLGPKSWRLNETCGPMGMALFFTLSGFLITRFLLHRPSVRDFLIRRLCRILPLAWLYMLIALPLAGAGLGSYVSHFLFYANLAPATLTSSTAHLWSICIEMQFYLFAAALVLLAGRRGLFVIPAVCLFVTGLRVYFGAQIAIATQFRVDEILAGCILALVHAHAPEILVRGRKWLNPYALAILLLIASHPGAGFMNYLRPYFAAALVGATLNGGSGLFLSLLRTRVLRYVAEVSYALYVLHPFLAETWLGSGERLAKYLKRPLLFAAIFATAHVSTFYYEHRWIALGKAWTRTRREEA